MDATQTERECEILNCIISAAHGCNLKLKPDAEIAVLAKFKEKGVTANVENGVLVLQAGTTDLVLSKTFATLRAENPAWFHIGTHDAAPTDVICREDFRGSPAEIRIQKTAWISEHGISAFENLPTDRKEAERRATVPHAGMNRASWLCLSNSDKIRMLAIKDFDLSRVMARTK